MTVYIGPLSPARQRLENARIRAERQAELYRQAKRAERAVVPIRGVVGSR